ncbi:MAG: hypothetical protein JO327_11160 [Nitrososphaeraceae archaeon]|nr:hypothetical protein [Nitrososphaeraceae archaeon]MBV9668673.1 hypothetical protein [Nitrososphaeraceae archaeon]
MVKSGYKILSTCDRLEMTMSHGENKLTLRDKIQHAAAVHRSEDELENIRYTHKPIVEAEKASKDSGSSDRRLEV